MRRHAGPAHARLIALACCLLVLWNFVLIRQYCLALIPATLGLDR